MRDSGANSQAGPRRHAPHEVRHGINAFLMYTAPKDVTSCVDTCTHAASKRPRAADGKVSRGPGVEAVREVHKTPAGRCLHRTAPACPGKPSGRAYRHETAFECGFPERSHRIEKRICEIAAFSAHVNTPSDFLARHRKGYHHQCRNHPERAACRRHQRYVLK